MAFLSEITLPQNATSTPKKSGGFLANLTTSTQQPTYTPMSYSTLSNKTSKSTPSVGYGPDTNSFLAEAAGFPLRAGLQAAQTFQEFVKPGSTAPINPKEDLGNYAGYFLGDRPIEPLQTTIPQGGGGPIDYIGQTAEVALGVLPIYGSLASKGAGLLRGPVMTRIAVNDVSRNAGPVITRIADTPQLALPVRPVGNVLETFRPAGLLEPRGGNTTKQFIGDGFTMTDKPDKVKVAAFGTITDYREALASYNKNPTPTKLARVRKLKAAMDTALRDAPPPKQMATQPARVPSSRTASASNVPSIPEQTRTAIASVETRGSNPLTYKDTKTVAQAVSEVKVPKAEATAISKVGRSIEAEAIEKKLTEGFEGTAGYDAITVKDQARRVAELIKNDIASARKMVRGEMGLPAELRGASLITGLEDYALKTKNAELLRELATSPLTSATSRSAQELRLLAERSPDSPVAIIQDVQKTRIAAANRRSVGGDITKAIRGEIQKKAQKQTWDEFVNEITC